MRGVIGIATKKAELVEYFLRLGIHVVPEVLYANNKEIMLYDHSKSAPLLRLHTDRPESKRPISNFDSFTLEFEMRIDPRISLALSPYGLKSYFFFLYLSQFRPGKGRKNPKAKFCYCVSCTFWIRDPLFLKRTRELDLGKETNDEWKQNASILRFQNFLQVDRVSKLFFKELFNRVL